MTGSLAPQASAPVAEGAPQRCLRLTGEATDRRVRELNAAFPGSGGCWVAADSVVFAEFVRGGIGDVLAPYGIDLGPDGTTPADGTVVVQTTHEVVFDADLLAGDLGGVALDVEVLPPEAEPVEDGVAATCQLLTRCAGRVALRTTLGLFLRRTFALSADTKGAL
jgi:hypothetical protein